MGLSDSVGVERLVLHVGAARCADSAVDDYVPSASTRARRSAQVHARRIFPQRRERIERSL
jgi:hypothetical protein